MRQFFSQESPLIQGLTWLADIILLNLLFLSSSLLIVTGGTAITAMYYVTLRRIRQEGTLWKDYWCAFRNNWKSATPIWLAVLLSGLILMLSFYFYLSASFSGSKVVLFLLGILTFCWGGVSIWSFVFLSHFEGTVLQTIQNAFRCSIIFFPKTVLLIAINIAPLVVLIAYTKEFLQLGVIWLTIWFAFAAWLSMVLLKKPIQKLEQMSVSADE